MAAKDYNITARVIGLLSVLILGGALAVETPSVQQRLASRATAALNKAFGADISFSSIRIKPFNIFEVKDLLLLDKDPYTEDRYKRGWMPADTFIFSHIVRGTVNPWGILKGEGIHIGRIVLEDARMHIVSEPDRNWPSNLARIFAAKPVPETPAGGPNLFDIRMIDIKNFRFRLNNFKESKANKKFGINFEDLDVSVNRLRAHGLKFSGGRLSFAVDEMDLREKSGYTASSIKGKTRIGYGKTQVYNFHLIDPWSDFKCSEYSMTYRNALAFQDFLEKVKMELRMKKSILGMRTVSYFAGIIPENTLRLNIEEGSHIKGYVSDLTIKDLRFTERGSDVSVSLSANVTGIPDGEICGNADIQSLGFTTEGAERLIGSISPSTKVELGGLAPGTRFTFSGKGSGSINRFKAEGRVASDIGEAMASVEILNLADPSHPTEISGNAGTANLDAGRLAGIGVLGKCTLQAKARAVLDKGRTSVIIDSVNVGRLHALGYEYSGITAQGKLTDGVFDGRMHSSDPNLDMDIEGRFGLNPPEGKSSYSFTAGIRKANLDSLNIDKSGRSTRVSANIAADFDINPGYGIEGEVTIRDIMLADKSESHEIGDVTIESHTMHGLNTTTISSPFVSGVYNGTIPVGSLPGEIISLTAGRHIPALFRNPGSLSRTAGGECRASLYFHNTGELLSFIKPGLYIADSTTVDFGIDREGILKAGMNSPRLALGRNYLKDASVEIDNLDESLNTILSGSILKVAAFKLEDPALTLYAKDNSAALGIHCTDAMNPDNYGEFYLNADLTRTQGDSLVIRATPMPSYFKFGDEEWKTNQSEIVLRDGSVDIDRFTVENGNQKILLYGSVDKVMSDTLRLEISDKTLDFLNLILEKGNGLTGRIGGVASLYSPLSEGLRMMADITCSETRINDEEIGDLRLLGAWDNEDKKFNIRVRNTLDGKVPLLANGFLKPADRSFGVKAALDSLKLASASPFLLGVFSEMGGFINGLLSAEGTLDSPDVSSEGLELKDALIRPALTGVSYTINGPVFVGRDGIHLENASLTDGSGGTGTITGGLKYNNFKDIRVDASVKARHLQAINVDEKDSKGFYGRLNADADITIKGPLNDMNIEGSVATSGPGTISIPINSANAQKGSSLLSFKKKEKKNIDPYELMLAEIPEKKAGAGNIQFNLNVTANSETQAHVEIDKSSGNVATAYGNGEVHFDMQTASSKMGLTGDYTLTGGKYHFEIPGVIGKDFNVMNGSSVKFRGDIMDTEIDLTAVYNLKASLAPIISDTSSVSSRRNVECLINVTGQLRNMKIGFGINVPDLDPSTKSLVESALNTDDKIQQQFVALLVMGTFLPGGQSGVFNSNNILYSNVGGIMSNQMNNILQQLEIPVDLGFGFQQNEAGPDIFDVAVSTQLFNNRVEVNGSVGNRKYSTTSAATGEMVGDIDIEYKINPTGQFRLKMFSHSADEFTSFLDYSQRNGVGISYQKGFNSFKEFFKNLFRPRKNRETEQDIDDNQNTVIINE